ncbi:DUF1659 domain-containing protein [Desulfotomaculum varum]
MAVVKQSYSCSMKLRYQNGVNAQGDPVFINSTYSKVKVTAADQDIYDVAQAINSLQSRTLVAVNRVDDNQLVSE